MQTPLQAPVCLWEHNQETGDTANSQAWISHPGRGWRLQTYPHSTQRNKALNKEKWLHFTASESPALRQRRRQVFSTHHPWQNPSWHPFNMGSPLLEWRPQPLGAPDTPLPWHAVPALARPLCPAVDVCKGGLVRGVFDTGGGGA